MVDFLRKHFGVLALLAAFAAWAVTPTQASFSPSVVRSKSSGVVTIAAGGGGSNTGTLSTTLTNTGKAHLSMNGCSIDSATADEELYLGRMVITNTTTVTLTRGCSGTCSDAATTCAYDVVEFY